MGQEVLPALRDIARRLDLRDPFEANTPVSLAATPKSELLKSTVCQQFTTDAT